MLPGRFGIGDHDLDDIHQDLHQQVWEKLDGVFAPGDPGYRAAVRRTVDSKIKDMIDHCTAEKRKAEFGVVELDAPLETESQDGETFGDSLDLERRRVTDGSGASSWHRRREAKIDVPAALARLPQDLRRLADTIDELGGNYSAAERELGLTRKKFRCDLERLRALMKEFLEM